MKSTKACSRKFIYNKFYPIKKRLSKSQIRQLFWDFYTLEFLASQNKDNYFAHKRLENLLQEMAEILLREQLMALEASVRGEMRYFIKACRYPNQHNSAFEDRLPDFLISVYKKYTPISLDLPTIAALFDKNVWDDSYGGHQWSKATTALINAKKAFETKCLKDMIFHIDHIFDLQHNDGFLLNKTNFHVIEDDMDERHDLEDIDELPTYRLSKRVKRELKSVKSVKKAA